MGNCCARDENSLSDWHDEMKVVDTMVETQALQCDARLTVRVVAARGLRDADWSSIPGQAISDAYCVVSGGDKELTRSKTATNALEPYWDHEVGCPGYRDDMDLTFTVWDTDPAERDGKLGTAVLGAEQFRDGFSGELELQEGGLDGAYITVMVRKAWQPYPKGPPTEFSVTVERGAGDFGVEVDSFETGLLYVSKVGHGALKDYNDQAQPACRLLPGQYITEVNEVSGDATQMKKVCAAATRLVLTVRRPLLWTIGIDKAGSLGVDLQISGTSLVVTAVEKGPFKDWNVAHGKRTVKAGSDRIIAVGGERGSGRELLDDLKPDGPKQLLMSRLSPDEPSPDHFFSRLRGDA